MKVGITGHQNIPRHAVGLVRTMLKQWLADQPDPLSCVTSLADGADQMCAALVVKVSELRQLTLSQLCFRGRETSRQGTCDVARLVGLKSNRGKGALEVTEKPNAFEQRIQPAVRDAVIRIEGFRVMKMVMCGT